MLGLLCLVLAVAVVYERWPVARSGRRIEAVIQDRLQAAFEQEQQRFFDTLHPVGHATGVAVRNVTVTGWKQGVATGRCSEIQVLSTNGPPGTEAGELAGYVAGTLIFRALTW